MIINPNDFYLRRSSVWYNVFVREFTECTYLYIHHPTPITAPIQIPSEPCLWLAFGGPQDWIVFILGVAGVYQSPALVRLNLYVPAHSLILIIYLPPYMTSHFFPFCFLPVSLRCFSGSPSFSTFCTLVCLVSGLEVSSAPGGTC